MRLGTTVCAGFNILAGGAGLFAGSVLTWMTWAMGGGISQAAITLSLAAGGGLYALAGICLLLPGNRGWKKAMALQMLAIVLGGTYLVALILIEGRNLSLDPSDEEVVMFVLFPIPAIALAILELGYLRANRPRV